MQHSKFPHIGGARAREGGRRALHLRSVVSMISSSSSSSSSITSSSISISRSIISSIAHIIISSIISITLRRALHLRARPVSGLPRPGSGVIPRDLRNPCLNIMSSARTMFTPTRFSRCRRVRGSH